MNACLNLNMYMHVCICNTLHTHIYNLNQDWYNMTIAISGFTFSRSRKILNDCFYKMKHIYDFKNSLKFIRENLNVFFLNKDIK